MIDKEAVYDTVHHEAEGYYEDKKVIDQEAVYEDVLVSPEEGHWETQKELVSEAWTETINHPSRIPRRTKMGCGCSSLERDNYSI